MGVVKLFKALMEFDASVRAAASSDRDAGGTDMQEPAVVPTVPLGSSRPQGGSSEPAGFFDMLAEISRGPKRFDKDKPQAPSCVYSGDGGSVYVGAFVAAEDKSWLRTARVGLVVSVLGARQRLPVVPRGVKLLYFCADLWCDVGQWRLLSEAVRSALDAGQSVLFHCMAGIHRAPMCAAGALAVLCRLTFEAAYKMVVDSGRYVEPHRFKSHVGDDVMRSLLACVAQVRTAFADAAPVGEVKGGGPVVFGV